MIATSRICPQIASPVSENLWFLARGSAINPGTAAGGLIVVKLLRERELHTMLPEPINKIGRVEGAVPESTFNNV